MSRSAENVPLHQAILESNCVRFKRCPLSAMVNPAPSSKTLSAQEWNRAALREAESVAFLWRPAQRWERTLRLYASQDPVLGPVSLSSSGEPANRRRSFEPEMLALNMGRFLGPLCILAPLALILGTRPMRAFCPVTTSETLRDLP